MRPTATVSPPIARPMSDRKSQVPFFLISFFQPALPVLRSTIWRTEQLARSVVPFFTPMTILPSAVGVLGAAHTSAGRSSFHLCLPSATE
ncbi:hypothetical protein SBADM41S_02002 [Streptomyces badius]